MISKMRNLIVAGALLFSSSLVLLPAFSQAAPLFEGSKNQACKGAGLDNGTSCDAQKGDSESKVSGTIKAIVDLLTIIVGIAAVIVIIVNGLRFITAGGDTNSINSARNGIIYAIVGLIVVAFAQIIVRFVLTRVG